MKTFNLVSTPKKSRTWFDDVFNPIVPHVLKNTIVKKDGDGFKATPYGIQDFLNLQIGGVFALPS